MAILKLPVIDFLSPRFESGTVEWIVVRDEVKQALETYGCFEARFEKVPVELQKPMLGSVQEFLMLRCGPPKGWSQKTSWAAA